MVVVELAGYLRWRSGDRIQLWLMRHLGESGRREGGSMYRPQGHTAQVSRPGAKRLAKVLQKKCHQDSQGWDEPPYCFSLFNLPGVLLMKMSFYRRLKGISFI